LTDLTEAHNQITIISTLTHRTTERTEKTMDSTQITTIITDKQKEEGQKSPSFSL
jgi:hypothetical protein